MSARKGFILGILLLLSLPVLAQKSKLRNMPSADQNSFHFGYSVGINRFGGTILSKDGYQVDLVQNPGININLITDYRLGKYLNVRFLPGIQFTQRDLTVTNKMSLDTKTWKVESIFIDLPLLLKYRALRVNNFAPYLIAGVNPRFDLTRAEIVGWKPATPMLKSFDICPELGVGIDLYTQMVKVAVELKFSIGMRDIFLGPEDPLFNLYVSGVDKIYSRMVVLSFHVEQSK